MLRAASSSASTVVWAAIRGPYRRISTHGSPLRRSIRVYGASSVPARMPSTIPADSATFLTGFKTLSMLRAYPMRAAVTPRRRSRGGAAPHDRVEPVEHGGRDQRVGAQRLRHRNTVGVGISRHPV